MTTVFEQLKELWKESEEVENTRSIKGLSPEFHKFRCALVDNAPSLIAVVEAAKVATEKAPDDIWHFSEMEGWKVGHMPHWLMDLTEAIAELDKEVF